MYDKKELCEKIRELYPDIGECGIDVELFVEFREGLGAIGKMLGIEERFNLVGFGVGLIVLQADDFLRFCL